MDATTTKRNYLVRARFGWGWDVHPEGSYAVCRPVQSRGLAQRIADALTAGATVLDAIKASGGRCDADDGRIYDGAEGGAS